MFGLSFIILSFRKIWLAYKKIQYFFYCIQKLTNVQVKFKVMIDIIVSAMSI